MKHTALTQMRYDLDAVMAVQAYQKRVMRLVRDQIVVILERENRTNVSIEDVFEAIDAIRAKDFKGFNATQMLEVVNDLGKLVP